MLNKNPIEFVRRIHIYFFRIVKVMRKITQPHFIETLSSCGSVSSEHISGTLLI